MDAAGDPLTRGEDLIEPDETVGGRHRAEYASRADPRDRQLERRREREARKRSPRLLVLHQSADISRRHERRQRRLAGA
jgi:hypothetical protein